MSNENDENEWKAELAESVKVKNESIARDKRKLAENTDAAVTFTSQTLIPALEEFGRELEKLNLYAEIRPNSERRGAHLTVGHTELRDWEQRFTQVREMDYDVKVGVTPEVATVHVEAHFNGKGKSTPKRSELEGKRIGDVTKNDIIKDAFAFYRQAWEDSFE